MSTLPRAITRILNARLLDGSTCDVALTCSVVTGIHPAGSLEHGRHHAAEGEFAADVLDLEGFVLMTAPAEPHAHLDKALSFDLIDPPLGDLDAAIASWGAFTASMTEDDIAERARRQALAMLQNGTTAVRSHVDTPLAGDDPLRGIRAVTRVRDELAEIMQIEIVVLTGSWASRELIEEALDISQGLLGGASHLADDPDADLCALLAIAEARGIGVDMHTDESLHGPLTMTALARATRDWPKTQGVTAGHCVRLGTLDARDLDAVIDDILASNIGIVSLPITNLYLQGWDHPASTPRGLTALRRLIDRGARVAAGADNVRDPFNPVGRSDALETASLLVTAGHLTLREACAAISDGARDVMGLPAAGVAVGAQAELLAVRASSASELIATASPDRFVIHAGRLVAQSAVTQRIAPIASSTPTTSHHQLLLIKE